MTIDKEDKAYGIELQAKDFYKQFVKHHKLFERYEVLQTAYNLIVEFLRNDTDMEEIDKFVLVNKDKLTKDDLEGLRKVRDFVLEGWE